MTYLSIRSDCARIHTLLQRDPLARRPGAGLSFWNCLAALFFVSPASLGDPPVATMLASKSEATLRGTAERKLLQREIPC